MQRLLFSVETAQDFKSILSQGCFCLRRYNSYNRTILCKDTKTLLTLTYSYLKEYIKLEGLLICAVPLFFVTLKSDNRTQ